MFSMMKTIQKYYNSYIDEECQKQPKNKFSTKLSFEKDGEGDILLRLLNKLDYSEKYSIMSLN